MKGEYMGIIIGADLVPTVTNEYMFVNRNVSEVFDNGILEILNSAEKRIFNLETVLTTSNEPIVKLGPSLKTNPEVVNGFKQIGVDIFTLANNHIMDFGKEGLNETIVVLEKNDIMHVGVGNTLDSVKHSCILKVLGKKVGIYACAEHEFSIATDDKPGANPFDPLESFDHIDELKKKCDYVIVLYHGGKEYYRYPSPLLQKICRKMCTSGADLVVCQHSHCIGCEERYNDSTIVYGQGNFLFDASDDEFFSTSILIDVEFCHGIAKVSYIPIVKDKYGVRKANAVENSNIISMFNERSSRIQDADFIKEEYEKFAKLKLNGYINGIYGNSILFRTLNKLSGYKLNRHLKQKTSVAIQNYIECESHRELLLTALKNITKIF